MKQKKGGKHRIIEDITGKGITYRKASKVLDQVIRSWTYALWCGEDVEVPGGILQAKYVAGVPKERLQDFRNINTNEPMVRRFVYPGRRRVIKLKPVPKLL